ncbi:DUF402 domain-containing protein [Rossellomorea marisflavi]|uniref:DUF402 domain-containing protein n=1 Tax=Rossellomorea marisflavi TaxID=189381 RepID=UPI003D2F28F5
MKRKFADRRGWERILDKRYAAAHTVREGFDGRVALIEFLNVREPLWKDYGYLPICLVDKGYQWLQHFPDHGSYALTTMFDDRGEVIQWYIDICDGVGEDGGVPWLDDLYLDLVVLPSGETKILDAEELDEALKTGAIDRKTHSRAWEELKRISQAVKRGEFCLLEKAREDRAMLSSRLRHV